MFRHFLIVAMILLAGCRSQQLIVLPPRSHDALTGTAFYKQVMTMSREEREETALREILSGNIPPFMNFFVRIKTSITGAEGNTIHASYFVMPDYLCIGSNEDFARIPLTPATAQRIADGLQCFLPTRKMVDDIYRQAVLKLEPVPMYMYRDSALVFRNHHLVIEGQRRGRTGLVAGIKKDVVLTGQLKHGAQPHRVAIYGWHLPGGKPIQPLYTGHVDWYVDYSHGIRLVYKKIKVNGQWMDYTDVLQHPVYKALLCDEEFCDCYRYE